MLAISGVHTPLPPGPVAKFHRARRSCDHPPPQPTTARASGWPDRRLQTHRPMLRQHRDKEGSQRPAANEEIEREKASLVAIAGRNPITETRREDLAGARWPSGEPLARKTCWASQLGKPTDPIADYISVRLGGASQRDRRGRSWGSKSIVSLDRSLQHGAD